MKNNDSLEKKRWYRLLKVIYIFSAIFLVLIAFGWAWTAKPESVIDYAKITCSNGYSVNSNDIGISFISETIFPSDDEKIRMYCVTNPDKLEGVQKALKLGISLEAIQERLSQENRPIGNANKNYEAEYVYVAYGSWTNFLLIFASISFFGLIFIDAIRRTLLYVVVGKRFF